MNFGLNGTHGAAPPPPPCPPPVCWLPPPPPPPVPPLPAPSLPPVCWLPPPPPPPSIRARIFTPPKNGGLLPGRPVKLQQEPLLPPLILVKSKLTLALPSAQPECFNLT